MSFTASASTVAAHSAAFAVSIISATSAVSAVFSIPLISVRFLLTAGDLEFRAFQGRVTCAGAKGGSGGGVSLRRWPRADNIALLPAADFLLSSRSYWFITARSIYSRVGQSDELSSMRTLAAYCGVSPLRMTMSMSFGSTGWSTRSSSFTI